MIAIAIIAKEVRVWVKRWSSSFWKSGSLVRLLFPEASCVRWCFERTAKRSEKGREAQTEAEAEGETR